MMNIEKYKNDGWGLSKKCFQDIYKIINQNQIKNVVEFGSGKSTEFFVDILESGKDFKLISYDDDIEFAAKVTHPNLELKVVSLVETSDVHFNEMFEKHELIRGNFYDKTTPVHTKQKNTFYYVGVNDLPDKIDLMVIDGPHGNGRNIAFLHGIGRLKAGSFVVIDDYNHYDFVGRFKTLFPDAELVSESNTGGVNQWELGGIYKIFMVK